ncbi:biopolymer transporter ExbB [Roseovarius sp. SCSIO 43702]|uniref:biopolymer transporter ExbB n=1 Tax=Roseovarius sp. SCSIO 43702 TaxID=2823043 RepID=UPI001C72B219|nr:biopolymer transporter ExbB [Roseovarius sp. SCSIO 43702]QYX56270.1 biopolymer transporter ExbB [Roseovarius sp. SCSIO 43702]
MDQPDREVEPQFSTPVRQIVLMLIVLVLTGLGVFVALPRVLPVFLANPYLNGFIFFVFLIGVVACFWQVFQLIGSVRWIEDFAARRPGHEEVAAPQLLAPLASLLRQRSTRRMQIAQSSARSILDSVAQRIDEVREITRYIVNMLIFLGLLGTFYGLATTVPAVVDTIRSLAPQDGEGGVEVFNRLMTGLEAQLGGMGVAFASSLLGLTGSLVVGLLELFAGHGQNRFHRELEEWMSTITRVGFASHEGEGTLEQNVLGSVVDHMSEQMEALGQMMTQTDISRAMVDEKLGVLADAIERMADRMGESRPEARALAQVAEGQRALIERLEARAEEVGSVGLDAESRMRLRSIDVQMLRILEEISAGRQETMTELRTDLNALMRIMGDRRGVMRDGGGDADPRGPER